MCLHLNVKRPMNELHTSSLEYFNYNLQMIRGHTSPCDVILCGFYAWYILG